MVEVVLHQTRAGIQQGLETSHNKKEVIEFFHTKHNEATIIIWQHLRLQKQEWKYGTMYICTCNLFFKWRLLFFVMVI